MIDRLKVARSILALLQEPERLNQADESKKFQAAARELCLDTRASEGDHQFILVQQTLTIANWLVSNHSTLPSGGTAIVVLAIKAATNTLERFTEANE